MQKVFVTVIVLSYISIKIILILIKIYINKCKNVCNFLKLFSNNLLTHSFQIFMIYTSLNHLSSNVLLLYCVFNLQNVVLCPTCELLKFLYYKIQSYHIFVPVPSLTWISNTIILMFNCLKWVMVVRFVDIGGIVDHHRLNFLFIMVYSNDIRTTW